MNHPDEDMMLRYVSNGVSEQEQIEIDIHLADCSECLEHVRTLRYIQEEFDSLWNSWTAAEHGRVYRQWHLAKALREIAEAQPSLAERAGQWFGQLRESLEISAKVLINRSKRVASLVAPALPVGYEFRPRFAYVGVASPEEQRKLEEHLRKSTELLAEDKTDEAIDELLEAIEIDARYPQAAVSEVYHEGRLVLQTIVNSRHRRISVKYWSEESEKPPDLAILLPKHSGMKAVAAEFEQVEDESYVLAELVNVIDGVYSLRIGPCSYRSEVL